MQKKETYKTFISKQEGLKGVRKESREFASHIDAVNELERAVRIEKKKGKYIFKACIYAIRDGEERVFLSIV